MSANNFYADNETTLEAREKFIIRKKRYDELLGISFPARFPLGVDEALSYEGELTLIEYVQTQQFLDKCIVKYAKYDPLYKLTEWNLESLKCGFIEGGVSFIDLIAKSYMGYFNALMPGHPSLKTALGRAELRQDFVHSIASRIPDYCCGKINEEGNFVAHDFSGDLYLYAYVRVKDRKIQELRRSKRMIPLDEFLNTEGEEWISFASTHHTKDFLPDLEHDAYYLQERIVKRLLIYFGSRRELWEVFVAAVYGEQSIRDKALELGVKHTTLLARLRKIQDMLADEFTDMKPEGKAIQSMRPFETFAKTWAEFMPYEVFVQKVPPPEH